MTKCYCVLYANGYSGELHKIDRVFLDKEKAELHAKELKNVLINLASIIEEVESNTDDYYAILNEVRNILKERNLIAEREIYKMDDPDHICVIIEESELV